jgi:simple sugar transport system substrate-binding protein
MSKILISCVTVALVGSALAAIPVGGVAQDGSEHHVSYITAGRGGAAEVMEAGARQAAADMGVTLDVRSLRSVDPSRMEQQIETAAAARPDGLVIVVDDIGPLTTPIETAAAMGIPIVWAGPLDDAAMPSGVLVRVGPDDSLAGVAAGRQLSMLGVTNALCLKVDVGDPADSRCSGAAIGLAEEGGTMDVLTAIDPAGDPSGIRGAVAARLLADPTIDGILMTDANSTSQTLGAIAAVGRGSGLTVATFDIGSDALDALEANEMAFAVDQQPFLQGYLPVMVLALQARAGLLPGGGDPLLVGPVMVTPEDAARVRTLHQQGVR